MSFVVKDDLKSKLCLKPIRQNLTLSLLAYNLRIHTKLLDKVPQAIKKVM